MLTMTGVPSESERPLRRACSSLLWPVWTRPTRLPAPQRAALDAALGVSADAPADPFRTGPGRARPARRRRRARAGGRRRRGRALARRRHGRGARVRRAADRGRPDRDADHLARGDPAQPARRRAARAPAGAARRGRGGGAAARAATRGLPAATRKRILAQAQGNPLGLVELLAGAARAEQETALPSWLPLSTRLERTFAARVADLPQATRIALLVAALTDRADVTEVLGAASRVSGEPLGLEVLTPAVAAGLVELAELRVRFGHPLMRSAIAPGRPGAAAAGGARGARGDVRRRPGARDLAPRRGLARHRRRARGRARRAWRRTRCAAARWSPPRRRSAAPPRSPATSPPAARGCWTPPSSRSTSAATTSSSACWPTPARSRSRRADQPRRAWLQRISLRRAPEPAWFEAHLDADRRARGAGDAARASQALLTVAFRAWWSDVPQPLRDAHGRPRPHAPAGHARGARAGHARARRRRRSTAPRSRRWLERIEPDELPSELLRVAAAITGGRRRVRPRRRDRRPRDRAPARPRALRDARAGARRPRVGRRVRRCLERVAGRRAGRDRGRPRDRAAAVGGRRVWPQRAR